MLCRRGDSRIARHGMRQGSFVNDPYADAVRGCDSYPSSVTASPCHLFLAGNGDPFVRYADISPNRGIFPEGKALRREHRGRWSVCVNPWRHRRARIYLRREGLSGLSGTDQSVPYGGVSTSVRDNVCGTTHRSCPTDGWLCKDRPKG